MREDERERHLLLRLVGGIAEHDALITGANILVGAVLVDTLGNVGRLFFETVDDGAGAIVQSLLVRIVTDFLFFMVLFIVKIKINYYLDFVTNDILIVDVGLGRDLPTHHDHARLGKGLAGDLGARVLCQVGV